MDEDNCFNNVDVPEGSCNLVTNMCQWIIINHN
jgi:hypothetical protein